MDSVPVADVEEFEEGLRDYMRTRHADLLDGIVSSGELGDTDALDAAIGDFTASFTAGE